MFSISFYEWEDKDQNLIKDCLSDDIPDDLNAIVLTVICVCHGIVKFSIVGGIPKYNEKQDLLLAKTYADTESLTLLRYGWNKRALPKIDSPVTTCSVCGGDAQKSCHAVYTVLPSHLLNNQKVCL